MIRFAGSLLASVAAFLVEVGRVLGARQASRQIAADAARESDAARAAVAKGQAEAKAKGDIVHALRQGEL